MDFSGQRGAAGVEKVTGFLVSNADKLDIGGRRKFADVQAGFQVPQANMLKAKLDDLRLYNRLLSADEIYKTFALGVLKCPKCKGVDSFKVAPEGY